MRFRRSRERPTPAKHPCDFGRPGRDLHQPSTLAISASDFGIRFRNEPSNWQLSWRMYGFALMRADSIDRYWPRKSWPENGASRLVYPAIHSTFHALTRRLDAIANEGGLSAVESLVLSVAAPDGGDLRDTPRHRTAALDSQLDPEPAPEPRPPQAGGGISDRRYVEVRLTFDGQIHAVMAREAMEELERELAVFVSPADRAAAGRAARGGNSSRAARSGPRLLTRLQQSLLERPHGCLFLRGGVIPSTNVQHAVGDEQPQLVRCGPADIPGLAAPTRPCLSRRALDRDDDVAKVDTPPGR